MSRKICNRAEAPTKVPRASPTCRAPSESSRRRLQWPRGAQNADWLMAGSVAAHCGNSWRKGQRYRNVLWRIRRKRLGQFLRSSVFVFVGGFAVDVFEERLVVRRLADDVFFAGPVAEVVELTAFAAERKFRVRVGVRRLLADGAAEFHAVKNTAKCGAMRIGRCGKTCTACRAPAKSYFYRRRGVAGTGRSSSADAAAKAIAAWTSAGCREGQPARIASIVSPAAKPASTVRRRKRVPLKAGCPP